MNLHDSLIPLAQTYVGFGHCPADVVESQDSDGRIVFARCLSAVHGVGAKDCALAVVDASALRPKRGGVWDACDPRPAESAAISASTAEGSIYSLTESPVARRCSGQSSLTQRQLER